jgi:hypothetical protein
MSALLSTEDRLRVLEETLRVGGSSTTASAEDGGLMSRLTATERQVDAFLTGGLPHQQQGGSSSSPSLKQLWEESNKLLRELNPGTALTHQQQIAAPILYRRQEVLASAESLHQNMQQVQEVLTLLSIGQPQMIAGGEPVSEMQVTKAHILTQTTPPSKEDQERLRETEETLRDVQSKVESIAARMDRLVAGYHSVVAAVSEKMVLADEIPL